MNTKKLTILSGDGIGPEVAFEAEKLLKIIEQQFEYKFEIQKKDFGGIAVDKYGVPLPEDTLQTCKASDVVLLSSIGGPKYDNLPREKRPEAGLLSLRSELGAFANLRPVIVFSPLLDTSTIKRDTLSGTDLIIVRELTGGLYFGKPKGIEIRRDQKVGFNTMIYSELEIKRVAKIAFEIATKRKKKVTSIDKANVLDVSQLWRDTVTEVSKEYKDVKLEHMLVDNAAMQLIKNPKQFDVILAENLFGDILSDEAAMLTGSIGMLPSASLGDPKFPAIYEPVHGSAPDIAGKNLANPIAMLLSVAMMFKYSFNNEEIYNLIIESIKSILEKKYRTKDISQEGCKLISTREMGDEICKEFQNTKCLR